MPINGEQGGGMFLVFSQSASDSTKTFFRVTHARDSIDAIVEGAFVSKHKPPTTTAALTWGYY